MKWLHRCALAVGAVILSLCVLFPKPIGRWLTYVFRVASEPQPVSSPAEGLLRSLIDAANLPESRWSNFRDYRQSVRRFYEGYGYCLPWIKDMAPTRQAREAVAILQNADQKGLAADDYDAPRWSQRFNRLRPAAPQPRESDAVRFDLALTVSLMRYISDLHIGKVDPVQFHVQADVQQRKYDLAEFLTEHVVHADNVAKALANIEPPYPGYKRTIDALQTYTRIAREDDGELLPRTKKPMMPGDSYPGVPRLTRLLSLTGDLPAAASTQVAGTIYAASLVDAVKSFQQRNGLVADGRIDSKTLQELNVPLVRRVRQIQLTLERWRWMPDEYQHSPIVVNIPEFRLRAYNDQFNIAVTMNVIVGEAYGHHDTPVFMGNLRYVVFRPAWEVPPDIAENEIIPAMRRDPAYAARENLEFVDEQGHTVNRSPITSDTVEQIREGRLSLRQRPGPKNSLGLVKFVFPNNYDVYMHDTPATELFARSRRDFSHGCIRLEKPAELALWVLRGNPGWTMERIRTAMNADQTQTVELAHTIPVLIVYGTVTVSEDGLVHFYDDIYGQDAALDQALRRGYPYSR
jgi:L,D-transpeptidase YcbB